MPMIAGCKDSSFKDEHYNSAVAIKEISFLPGSTLDAVFSQSSTCLGPFFKDSLIEEL